MTASRTVLQPASRAALAAVLLAGALAGCASDRPAASAPAATTAGPSSPTGSASPGATPDAMAVPAKRSGPLTGRDMPRPAALGPGWAFRVDSGNQEDGYAGNGTPTVERDPSEVADLAVPLGCVKRGNLPRPRWALESDYSHGATGTIGLVVRLRFATAGDATTFMKRRDAALAACAAQTARQGPNSTGLVQQLRTVAGRTVSTRTEAGDLNDGSAWTEIAGSGSPGRDVTLVAVNAGQSEPVARRMISSAGYTR